MDVDEEKRRGRMEAEPMERTILVIVAIMDGQTEGHEIKTVAGKTYLTVLYLRKKLYHESNIT